MTVEGFEDVVKDNWSNQPDWNHARSKFERKARKWHLNYGDSPKKGYGELQEILVREELAWFQRSRCNWLKYGDKNTRYFHSSTVARRRHNRIIALRNDEGAWVAEKDDLINMAVKYFENMFSANEEELEAYPVKGFFPGLSTKEKEYMSRVPTDEEIRRTIFQMGKFKAPGLDGLQAVFFHSHWSIMGNSICSMISKIFLDPKKVEEVNKTLVCLIPKKKSPESMKDFRPISLCNVVYKTITKIITERLNGFMTRLVAPTQCSFIKGRQSVDNIIIAQEVVLFMRKKKGNKGWMMMKVDLEKAYDRLSWIFIKETLVDIGFSNSLIDLICNYVSTSKLNLLWNGSLTREFEPKRGIRQGDPISPYLFVVCIERLAHLIQLAVDSKAWKPVFLNKRAPPLSHLFFADDIILCAEASVEQAFIINQVLKIFSAASRQKISENKSRVMFSRNVGVTRAKEIGEKLGVGITNDLGKYLGVNLSHKRASRISLINVMEMVYSRLSSWNHSPLSLAGRITLEKSVLEALPAYTMQSTIILVNVCPRRKEEEGLGLRDQKTVNKVFSMKIGYGMMANKDALWARILRSKYMVSSDLVPVLKENRNGSSTWKGIHKNWSCVQNGLEYVLAMGAVQGFGGTVGFQENWQCSKFEQFLEEEIIRIIKDVHPPTIANGPDLVMWSHSSTDGACCKKRGSSSCGGVVRDYAGQWIAGFSKKIGYENVLLAEVILETDSMEALRIAQDGCPESHPCHTLIVRMKEALGRTWKVELSHTLREGNKVADCMAGHASALDWEIVWHSFPPVGFSKLLLNPACE
ncbi:uncharacterized protein LOC133294051 [Gastrolobium bilobum]|uniref:uncharacterized protein LOC133294051 n=1 Tax=Gastrolobium bilobum TaxID=150636 RepID=UPI002AAF5479|nr:uncharacterized protein LOC133294051 [Gastrolobium bilobum]